MKKKMSRKGVVLVLSGPTGVGKTTLASWLAENSDFSYLSTSQIIRDGSPSLEVKRSALQQAGNTLDKVTEFGWICHAVVKALNYLDERLVVVDSVRKPQQVSVMRKVLADQVVHCHLHASVAELKERHRSRNKVEDLGLSHGDIQADESESFHYELRAMADIALESVGGNTDALGRRLLNTLRTK